MKRRDESGFAMLLVFLMAASIAIMMYMQLPRAAFEAQRAKEEMLQDRGEQYIRAIQLYVAKWKSYPPSIDVLEKTNNVRYLRKRYKDPMTGEDEWRVIHVNSAGQLVDSIIKKKEGEEKKNLNTFIGEMPTVGGATPNAADAGQNIALRRRASDQAGAPGMGAGGAVPPVDPQSFGNGAQAGQAPGVQYPVPGAPGQPGQPAQQGQPGQPGQGGETNPYGQQQPNPYAQQPPNPYGQQQPNPNGQQQPNPYAPQPSPYAQQQSNPYQQQNPYGQQQPQAVVPNQPVQPGQPVGNQPGQFQPGQPQSGQPQGGQPQQFNSGMPYPVPTPPGLPAGVSSGASSAAGVQPGAPGAGTNQGLDMINKILTTPRSNMGVQGAQGLQIGGGIAGFASKYEAPSIKVYNERQKYNEWEFVYDMKKDKRLLGQAAGMMPNQQQNPLGGSNVPNPLQQGQGNNSSFNQGNSFNQGGSFNQGQGGFNQGQGGFNQGQGGGFNQNRGGFNQGSQQQQPLPIPGFPQPRR